MNTLLVQVTVAIVLLAVSFHFLFEWPQVKEDVNLIVLVLSSRYNFVQRTAIRNSWKKQASNYRTKVFFVVGNSDCSIVPSARLSPFSCQEATLNENVTTPLQTHVISNFSDKCVRISRGFSFEVNRDVIITGIGCLNFDKACSVTLIDVFTKELIIGPTTISMNETIRNGFRFASMSTPVKLSKSFIGLLHSEDVEENHCVTNAFHVEQSGRMTYRRAYDSTDDLESRPFNPKDGSFVSFIFVDGPASQPKLTEDLKFKRGNKNNNLLLVEEMRLQNDLISVPLIDVYSNLPFKLLEGISWARSTYNFQFLVKTDDDAFLNLSIIQKELQSLDSNDTVWWGNFRRNWVRNIYGKWAELAYESVTYPPFACGSGYLLSRPLIDWLDMNRDHLKMYQGEDTSLGIWLAAIDVKMKHDERWSCVQTWDIEGKISVPNLKSEEISRIKS